jgi:hypothetical protein
VAFWFACGLFVVFCIVRAGETENAKGEEAGHGTWGQIYLQKPKYY